MRMLLPRKAAVSYIYINSLPDFVFLTERISASEFETRSCSPSGSTYCFDCSKPSSNDVSCSLRDNNLKWVGCSSYLPMHACRLLIYFATSCPCNINSTKFNCLMNKNLVKVIPLNDLDRRCNFAPTYVTCKANLFFP